jgi:hypothetical protein
VGVINGYDAHISNGNPSINLDFIILFSHIRSQTDLPSSINQRYENMIALSGIKHTKFALSTHKCLLHRYLHLKPTIVDLERSSLHLERSENCLSGDEDDVARHKSSFDPAITNPEREFQTLDKECKAEGITDPLLYSPANLTVSLILKEIAEGGSHIEGGRERKFGSGNGWTRKGKLVHIKNIPGGPFDRYEKLLEVLKKRASDFSTKDVKRS